MKKLIELLKKQKFLVIIILLVVSVFISLIIIHNKNAQLKSFRYEVSNLEDKVEELEKKVKELEEEKDELENQVSEHESNDNTGSNSSSNSNDNTILRNQGSTISGYATVVYRKSGCDYMILENSSGYIIGEWMGGNDPDNGDKFSGNFNSFGTKDFYNISRGSNTRLWIDDYMLSKQSAIEKINEKCN